MTIEDSEVTPRNCPGVHAEQADEEAGANSPKAQIVQFSAPEVEYWPTMQSLQKVPPDAFAFPAGQAKQRLELKRY